MASSPSVRAGLPSRPEKVGRLFDSCHELPALLASAVVGNCGGYKMSYRNLLLSFMAVSRAFLLAVTDEIRTWCCRYNALKMQWLEAHEKNQVRQVYVFLVEMQKLISAAFGPEFMSKFGPATYSSSVYTPKVYKAMLTRRCLLCNTIMSGSNGGMGHTRDRGEPVSFTFSHSSCERKYCVHLQSDWRSKSVDKKFSPSLSDISASFEAIAAHMLPRPLKGGFGTPSPLVVDIKYLREHSSAFTRLLNKEVNRWNFHGVHILWFAPLLDVVSPADTLVGAFGLQPVDILRAKELADEAQNWLTNYRNERNERRLQETAALVQQRTTLLRIAMGAPETKLRLKSIQELEAAHPKALEFTGVFQFIDKRQRIAQPLQRVLRAVRYFEHICGQPAVCAATLDLFFDKFFQHGRLSVPGNCPIDVATPAMLRAIDEFRADQFKVTFVGLHMTTKSYSIRITTTWSNGPLSHAFNLPAHDLHVFYAQLVAAGVENLPDLPNALLEFDTDTSKAETCEFFAGVLSASLKSKRCNKRIAFELLGLRFYLDALLAHHRPADAHTTAEQDDDFMLPDNDDDNWFY